jgi:hypothetical protein
MENQSQSRTSTEVAALLRKFGCTSIEAFLQHLMNSDLSIQKKLVDEGMKELIKLQETGIKREEKYGMFVNGKVDTILMSDRESNLSFGSLSAFLSLVERCKSCIINRNTPIDYLNVNLHRVLKTIFNLVPMEEFKLEPLKYICQILHEEGLLVNSFDIRRVFAFQHERIKIAIEKINNSRPIDEILQCIAIIDPSAGWGCRLTGIMTIVLYLLNHMRESGNYTEEQLTQFANSVSYVGFDTNVELLPIYQQIMTVFADYGIGNAARFHMVDFCSDASINLLADYPEIITAFTSSPTVLEVYPHYGETLNKNGIDADNSGNRSCANWRNFVSGFLMKVYEILARFSRVCVVGNYIDDATISYEKNNGRVIKVKAEVATMLLSSLKKLEGGLVEYARVQHVAWDSVSPKRMHMCKDCTRNGASDCGNCSECNKGFGCPDRVNICSRCKDTVGGMRNLIIVRFR